MDKALHEAYVLLTNDLDFGELLAFTGYHFPSVIIFRLRDMRPANVNWHIERIIAEHPDSLQEGNVLSVDETRVRLRRLPIR